MGCPLLLACFIISKPPRQNSGQKHTCRPRHWLPEVGTGMQDRALLGLGEAIRISCRHRRGRRRDGGPGVRAASLLLCSAGGASPNFESASCLPRPCPARAFIYSVYVERHMRALDHGKRRDDAASIRRSRREHTVP